MKILLSNYRYFISGGPERYLFSVDDLLLRHHHQTIPFSIKNKLNHQNKWEPFFVDPVDTKESVYFEEYDLKISTITKVIGRMFYSREVYNCAKQIAKSAKPDLVYILHFLNKMSPSLIRAFKDERLPVIVRLSDFGMLCPEGHFLSHGNICEKCLNGGFYNVTLKKCIKNSYAASTIKCLSWYFHRMIKIYDDIDAFICPSGFTKNKMISGGFPGHKLHVIPTFIDGSNVIPSFTPGEYILYFGRSTREKGLELLIKEYNMIEGPKPPLKVITNLDDNKITNNGQHIEILPFINSRRELFSYIRNSMFVIVPSICYENLPNAILESFLNGKPVIASNLGSIPELVQHDINGLLFDPLKKGDLKTKIERLMCDSVKIESMGRLAHLHVEKHYNYEEHYNRLVNIFYSLL